MKWISTLFLWTLVAVAGAQPGPHPYCGVDHAAAFSGAQAFVKARAEGRLPVARKTLSPPEIGDTRTFNVSEGNWEPRTFTLKDKTDAYYLWVENGELANGHVTDGEITALRSSMFEQTPPASFNPDAGILANDHAVFGTPPDYDGDGLVDILFYDIGNAGTLGYVTVADIDPDAPPGVGNQADVLYLDANEGTHDLTTLSAIAAHEYTHLIHFNYGFDKFTFISEGLAEYAIVMNGYFWRGIDYLNIASEYALPLFEWRDGGGPNTRDYQRGGLFFTYISTRVGALATGSMVRTPADRKGAAGLDDVLTAEGLSLAEIIADFHLANYLNDVDLDARYGYPMPERQGLHAPPSRVINGQFSFKSKKDTTDVQSGSVQYVAWENVADFVLSADAVGADVLLPALRARLRMKVVLEAPDGTVTVESIEPGAAFRFFGGAFDRVTLVAAHVEPEVVITKVGYEADWNSQATPVEAAETLPARVTLEPNYPNPFNPATTIVFNLPSAAPVRLSVYDALGRRVAVPVDGPLPAGRHTVVFDAGGLAGGLYLYRLETPGRTLARTMMLLK